MVDFLFALTELFRCLLRSGVTRRNVYSSAIFTRESTFLHPNFT